MILKKACPGIGSGVGTGFGKTSAQTKQTPIAASAARTTAPYRCHSLTCVQFFERSAFRVLAPLYGQSLIR
jgi:hypothetical protein